MDRGHDDRFDVDDVFDLFDPTGLDVDDVGGAPPVDPPEEPPRRGPPPPPRPQPADDIVFSGAWTAGALTLMCLFGGLQAVMISVGARGGIGMVFALVLAFCVLFFVPLLAGTWWFWRVQGRAEGDPFRPEPPTSRPASAPRRP